MTRTDFDNPERWDMLEEEAYTGLLNISGFPAPEYKYFDKYAIIARQYREQRISRDEAVRQKSLLLTEYRAERNREEDVDHWWQARARAIQASEQARIDIGGETDITRIALIACEALSTITGDHMVAEKARRVIDAQKPRGDAQGHENGGEG